jgi:hypothetical protein
MGEPHRPVPEHLIRCWSSGPRFAPPAVGSGPAPMTGHDPRRCPAVLGNLPATRQAPRHGPEPHCLTGFQVPRRVLLPLGHQAPDGLDDVAAEQRGGHAGVLGEPPGGQDECLDDGFGFD